MLLDSLEVRAEVTAYAVELARRMGATLHLLFLLRWENKPSEGAHAEGRSEEEEGEGRERAERIVKACVDEIQGLEVQAVGGVRLGDPSSELLKYLAENEPFQAVVWAGTESFLRRRRKPVRTHWLERMREQLDCTLVVPSLKGRPSRDV